MLNNNELNLIKGEIGKIIDKVDAKVTIGKSEDNRSVVIKIDNLTLNYGAPQNHIITEEEIKRIKEEGKKEVLNNPEQYGLTYRDVKELPLPALEYKVGTALVYGSGHAAAAVFTWVDNVNGPRPATPYELNERNSPRPAGDSIDNIDL